VASEGLAFRRMVTGLRLLMRDGALYVTFQARLTSEQYAELVQVIERPDTKDELCEVLEEFAQHWGIEVDCDG
jgi:hypothetical protein